MVTGKVVRFDGVRGYGFVRPDTGGDDVFLHANDLLVDEHLVAPGAHVEFELEDGDRGPKASSVRLSGKPPSSAGGGGLSAQQFSAEMTELLLSAAPGITGEQIVRIRQRLGEFADQRGWLNA